MATFTPTGAVKSDIIDDMEKAAIDIYTVKNRSKEGFSYVDKTAILKNPADLSRGQQFFFARPRRSGKPINLIDFAVSTKKCIVSDVKIVRDV